MLVRTPEPMVCPKIGRKGCQMEIRRAACKKLASSAQASPRASSNLPFALVPQVRRMTFRPVHGSRTGTVDSIADTVSH
jgi:hypothetical protein